MDLLKWFRRETRATRLTSLDDRLATLFGMSASGQIVNARTAEQLATVCACVSAISSAVASLPVYCYRVTEDGKRELADHPLARLVATGPNRWQSWPCFAEWLMAEALLRGNGLAEVMRDDSGQVVELRPIPWSSVAVNLLPSGRIRFDYSDPVTNQQRQLFQEECLWLRDRSDNGMVGISRLSRAAGVVSNALSIQQFSTALYENGSWPGGFLETDNVLSQESKRLLVEQFEQAHQGPSKAARLMLLEAGLKFSPASPTPEDSELLSSRKFTVEEIGRIYNVPPPLIGNWEHASFTNSETAGRWFAQFTIAPWVRKLEMEISTSVLNDPDLTVEFDLSSFLRGDPKERWECNEIAVRNGILTVDEIREQEGYGPRPETNEAVTST